MSRWKTTWLLVPGVGRHGTAAMDLCRAGGSYLGANKYVRCPGARVLADVVAVLDAAGLEYQEVDKPAMPRLTKEKAYVVAQSWEVIL